MALVDLALAKKHLRVDWDDENGEIAVYLAAAETTVIEYLDRAVLAEGESLPEDDPHAMVITPPIAAAILLLTGELYERREPPESNAGEAMLSPVVRRLLAPYRVWRTMPEDC
ncbi:MAG TPA: head-tail connector protein [Pelagibacterium sp.]|uniref:head-tail connector protein n=1 Tax=Pelagibacterium sp. TaxID=1967288 RepID=UPI002BBC4AFF|nr:head-tail connector protein [Pelagibacterium sp.]HWJ89089.1 head-tail connector protein [Pelagibacterium sp.]